MPKIVLVDDDAHVRASAAKVPRKSGHAAVTNRNGVISALECAAFDRVVLGIVTPDGERRKTTREMHEKRAALPVLAISGGDRPGRCDYPRMAAAFRADDTPRSAQTIRCRSHFAPVPCSSG